MFGSLFYTAGTLLPFFWIVVILGIGVKEIFERVLFFLCWHSFFILVVHSSPVNAQLYYYLFHYF